MKMTYEQAKIVLELLVLSLTCRQEKEAVEVAIQVLEDITDSEDDLK